ncbi:hypothetical protein [Sphingomonas sp.]|uniref:hypothetical protein n=1 Tax=Sphingomonas sp. TaxID=28214 RepID=UPI00286CD9BD|nr:hypothetical protein [Sphingomonas sp.]
MIPLVFLFAIGMQGDPQGSTANSTKPAVTDVAEKPKVCPVRAPTGSIMNRRAACGTVDTTGDGISEQQLDRMRQEKQARDSVTMAHGL